MIVRPAKNAGLEGFIVVDDDLRQYRDLTACCANQHRGSGDIARVPARSFGLVASEMGERSDDGLDLRVSDAERDHVVELLKQHLTDGRLTTEDFSDRVGDAYSSKTGRDLERCLRELPRDPRAQVETAIRDRRDWRRGRLAHFLLPNAICIGVWALAGGGYFWPVWVLFGTGIVLTRQFMRGPHEPESAESPSSSPYSNSDAGGGARVLATCLFVDVVGSTELAITLGDAGWADLLQQHHRDATDAVARWGGHEIFTRGDELVAGFDSASRAVFCARDIRNAADKLGLSVRAGLHAGEMQRRGEDFSGIALHIGQRVSALAGAGEILVSSTVKDMATGSGIVFQDRGESELKGVPGTWSLFAVAD